MPLRKSSSSWMRKSQTRCASTVCGLTHVVVARLDGMALDDYQTSHLAQFRQIHEKLKASTDKLLEMN